MTTVFSCRKSAKKPISRRGRFLWGIPAILLFSGLCLNLALASKIASLAVLQGQNQMMALLEHTVMTTIQETPEQYQDLIRLTYKADGSVSAMETNYTKCNYACSQLLLRLLQDLRNTGSLSVEIPLGNLSGIAPLSNRGPRCQVTLLFSGGVTAHLASEFREEGINQSYHRILLHVRIESLLLLPGRQQTLTTETDIVLTETVILGSVPDAYTRINRLTDDIAEAEIDDIYDFGASQ